MDSQELDVKIKKEATSVLTRVVLFLVYYIALILIGIGLFVAAFGVTYFLVSAMTAIRRFNVYLLVLLVAMWWFCIQIAWYLVKPLFKIHKSTDEDRVEVKRGDCPKLFDLIESVASATGNKMPKHVYLTADVNACVFYNSTSIWSIFFPTPKNLEVGIGLLKGLNEDELKSILGHEFGHFSQGTMKVGSISYRLLLIIRGMIEMAEDQQKSASLASGSLLSWDTWFHLANKPIGFITKMTISFYNYIEKKNRNLSRLMEYEADSVACNVAGAKPFISSLCKTDLTMERYNEFQSVLGALLSQKKCLDDFVGGYDKVFKCLSEDEKFHFSNNENFLSPVGDGAKFKSKVKILNGWDTHPSTEERIENAMQYYRESDKVNTADACDLIPVEVQNSVGLVKQRCIAESLGEPVEWDKITKISKAEFCQWVDKLFEEKRVPAYLCPFIFKKTVAFPLPSEEEMATPVESPINDENRDLLLKHSQVVNDLYNLEELKEDGEDVDLEYDGTHYSDLSEVLAKHQVLFDESLKKVTAIDRHIYIYLWQRAKDRDELNIGYWSMFAGNAGIDALGGVKEELDYIQGQIAFYHANGQEVSLNKELTDPYADALRKYLKTFDFSKASQVCGSWKYGENGTVEDLLNRCKDFVSAKSQLDAYELFGTIEDLYSLVDHLYDFGFDKWKREIINAHLNI